MISISKKRTKEILKSGIKKRIMVIGDLMIDRYLWGNVSRISPEAPVPIINIADEEIRFGGAANVMYNLIGLKNRPLLVGVVGDDKWGSIFRERLRSNGLDDSGLISDFERPTTIKTRIIGNNQHIARVDRELTSQISKSIETKLISFIKRQMPDIDAVVLEDYNKGLLSQKLIKAVTKSAKKHNKIVTVDPKFDHFLDYKNVTLFKPNQKETAEALAMRMDNDADVQAAGEKLLATLNAENVLITLGSRGMALFEKNGKVSFTETRARKVADVSGAGDTVIATLTFALAAGATPIEAATLANIAAGAVCEEVGVVPISAEKLAQII